MKYHEMLSYRKSLYEDEKSTPPLYVMAPSRMSEYLLPYHCKFESILESLVQVKNEHLLPSPSECGKNNWPPVKVWSPAFLCYLFFLDRNTMFLRVVRLRKISENSVLDQTCLCKGRDNLPANRAKRLQLLARGLRPRKRGGQKSASLRFLISGKTLPIIGFQRLESEGRPLRAGPMGRSNGQG